MTKENERAEGIEENRGKQRKMTMKRNQDVSGEGNGRGNNNHHISHASDIQGDTGGTKSVEAQPRMERGTECLPRAVEASSFDWQLVASKFWYKPEAGSLLVVITLESPCNPLRFIPILIHSTNGGALPYGRLSVNIANTASS